MIRFRAPARLGLAAFAASLLVSACESRPDASGTPRTTAAQLLAQTACPHIIVDAAAWVDHMPGAGRPPRTLHVTARFSNPDDALVVLRSEASTADTLVLEIRPTPDVQFPGQLDYREPAPDPVYSRVVFRCRGGDVHTITGIEKVY